MLDRQGHILTNDHVVADASRVTVAFADGSTATATVSGEDASKDLAVLRVQLSASKLDPLPLGTSKSLVVGDAVLAIGNPFGYDRTVTAGIVSALGRTIEAPDGASITGTIQTDAAINHGNSGGPLIDTAGRVVGITSQIADSGVDGNVGVGFAIPIEDATAELGRLEGSSQT